MSKPQGAVVFEPVALAIRDQFDEHIRYIRAMRRALKAGEFYDWDAPAEDQRVPQYRAECKDALTAGLEALQLLRADLFGQPLGMDPEDRAEWGLDPLPES